MGEHYKHGIKKNSKEYSLMTRARKHYHITREEYCINTNKYPFPIIKHKDYKPGTPEYNKHVSLFNDHHISLKTYNEMFNEQKGCCDICGKHQCDLKKSLSVDHCHTTNKIRGLLCHNCNVGLGFFQDSIELLIKASHYLKQ